MNLTLFAVLCSGFILCLIILSFYCVIRLAEGIWEPISKKKFFFFCFFGGPIGWIILIVFLYDCIYDCFHVKKVIWIEKSEMKVIGETKYGLPIVTREKENG